MGIIKNNNDPRKVQVNSLTKGGQVTLNNLHMWGQV